MFDKNSLTKNKYPSQSIGSTSGLHILGGTIVQCACTNGTANCNGWQWTCYDQMSYHSIIRFLHTPVELKHKIRLPNY